jgi:hypothetical protein
MYKSVFFIVTLIFLSHSLSAQKVMVTSTVQNGVLTLFNCGCPSYDGDPAFAGSIENLDLDEKELEKLLELVTAFEVENGVHVNSKTQVRNFQTVKDKIKTTAKGPLSGAGKKLCDFIKSVRE